MKYNINKIVFPGGDSQEIEHTLNINQIVDINGIALPLPLPTHKMIAYRVYKISTKILRNEDVKQFHLDIIQRDEMESLSR